MNFTSIRDKAAEQCNNASVAFTNLKNYAAKGIANHPNVFLATSVTLAAGIATPDIKAIYLNAGSPSVSSVASSALAGLSSAASSAAPYFTAVAALAMANPITTVVALGVLCAGTKFAFTARRLGCMPAVKALAQSTKQSVVGCGTSLCNKVKPYATVRNFVKVAVAAAAVAGGVVATPYVKALYQDPTTLANIQSSALSALTTLKDGIAAGIATASSALVAAKDAIAPHVAPHIATAVKTITPYALSLHSLAIANPATAIAITAVTLYVLRKPIQNFVVRPIVAVVCGIARGMKNTTVAIASTFLTKKVIAATTVVTGVAALTAGVRDLPTLQAAISSIATQAAPYLASVSATAQSLATQGAAFSAQVNGIFSPILAAAALNVQAFITAIPAMAANLPALAAANPGTTATIAVIAIAAVAYKLVVSANQRAAAERQRAATAEGDLAVQQQRAATAEGALAVQQQRAAAEQQRAATAEGALAVQQQHAAAEQQRAATAEGALAVQQQHAAIAERNFQDLNGKVHEKAGLIAATMIQEAQAHVAQVQQTAALEAQKQAQTIANQLKTINTLIAVLKVIPQEAVDLAKKTVQQLASAPTSPVSNSTPSSAPSSSSGSNSSPSSSSTSSATTTPLKYCSTLHCTEPLPCAAHPQPLNEQNNA